MSKKIMLVALFFMTLLSVGSANKYVEARDYYVGQYGNGCEAYLMTETITRWDGADTAGYDCNVKAVSPDDGTIVYVNYHILREPSWGFIRNGVNLGQRGIGVVEKNIAAYLQRNTN